MKEVKKEKLYLTILESLRQGKTPVQISKELNIPKQNLQYYLNQFKKKGEIKKLAYGTWEVKDLILNTLTKNNHSIRGHAFIWNIKLPREIDWKEILETKKIDYKLVRGLIPRIYLNKKKVWLGKKTITLYEPENFYANNAVESRKYAFFELKLTLELLEKNLGVSIRNLENNYEAKPSREHYALVKNDLAKQVNRNGEKMAVSDEHGEWIWIDASDGIGELETGNRNALVNNLGVQRWWNEMKETKFEVTPRFLLNSINQVTQNQMMFNQNFESHVEAIKTLSQTVKELREKISLLNNVNKDLNKTNT